MMRQRRRVAIVEDHAFQRVRTEEVMRESASAEIVFSGESSPQFLSWMRSAPRTERPELLILDLKVDRGPSVEVHDVASLLASGMHILVVSALSSPALVTQVVRAGVTGVVSKQDSESDFLAAVHAVLRGDKWISEEVEAMLAADAGHANLSIQEMRALVLYASGLTTKEVGAAMNISRETAKQYLERVKRKYAANGVRIQSKLDFAWIAWINGFTYPRFLPRDDK